MKDITAWGCLGVFAFAAYLIWRVWQVWGWTWLPWTH